jgi:hypothetical protein
MFSDSRVVDQARRPLEQVERMLPGGHEATLRHLRAIEDARSAIVATDGFVRLVEGTISRANAADPTKRIQEEMIRRAEALKPVERKLIERYQQELDRRRNIFDYLR